MPSVEKRQRLQRLIARITLNPEGLEIRIRTVHLADILRSGEEIGACEPMTLPDQPVLVLTIAARLKRTGMEKKLLIGAANTRSQTKADAGLLKLIARAHELQEIFTRGGRPISEMAEEAGVSSSYFTRMLRLSFLAPDYHPGDPPWPPAGGPQCPQADGRHPRAHRLARTARRARLHLNHILLATPQTPFASNRPGAIFFGGATHVAAPLREPYHSNGGKRYSGYRSPTYRTHWSHTTLGPMHIGPNPPQRVANFAPPKIKKSL